MPRFCYDLPDKFLLLHHITMDAGDYEYIQIVLGGRCKASATNGSVAGVMSQTLAAKDVLKPVTTIYIKAKEAAKAFKRSKNKPLFLSCTVQTKVSCLMGVERKLNSLGNRVT